MTNKSQSSLQTPSSSQPTSIPFVTAYGKKNKTQICFPQTEGRTKQSHKDECDINRIMARYMATGVDVFADRLAAGQYGDVTAVSYQDAMNQVATANSMFHDLPAKLRNRFSNDPALFLDFVRNPANKAEAHELGLLRPDYDPNPPKQPDPVSAKPEAKTEVPKADK